MNAKRNKRVALYVRVSTDHQSVRNQEIELQAVAERHGWTVVAVYRDQAFPAPRDAISGRASTSCYKPSPARSLIWSQPGASIGWADR